MRPGETPESLSRDQLLELIAIYSKNWLAMDGVWFQSVERKYGMDEAMYHDVEAWRRFTVTEARRIKKFLGLPERPAWRAWSQALQYRFYANLSRYELSSKTADCCTVCWNALFSKRAPKGYGPASMQTCRTG